MLYMLLQFSIVRVTVSFSANLLAVALKSSKNQTLIVNLRPTFGSADGMWLSLSLRRILSPLPLLFSCSVMIGFQVTLPEPGTRLEDKVS